ncbi:hypothetical protein WNY59_12645 [Ahrensia kielensis]|uniref:Uncharacterized protein n=1 Tax=Ahrensia kielensis TaxID=76980 RepID=A0ABU9T8H9_9HYPH
MSEYIERMFASANLLAEFGEFSNLSEIQSELASEYPDAHHVLFNEKYSRKLTYLKELIFKHGKKFR